MPEKDDHEHYKQGIQFLQENRFQEAVEALRLAATTGRDYPLEHYALARALEKVSKWREAAGEYKRFLQMNPEPSQYTRHAERRLDELGKESAPDPSVSVPAEIEDVSKTAFSSDSPEELIRKGNLDEASRILTDLSETANTLNMQGLIAMEKEKLDEAEDLFQRSLRLENNHVPTLINFAILIFRKGCLDAAEILEQAAQMEPENTTPLFNQGLCLLRAGRASQAKDVLARALELDPSDEEARSLYGRACRGK